VQALAFSPGGRWALSAADGERHVAIWPAAGRERGGRGRDKKDKKKRKAAAAAGLLALEEPAAALATAPALDGAADDACFQARLRFGARVELGEGSLRKFSPQAAAPGSQRAARSVTCAVSARVQRGWVVRRWGMLLQESICWCIRL